MAHKEQQAFVAHCRACLPDYFRNRAVLEIGSLIINGTVREFFENCRYVGIDIGAGPGVDVVARGETYRAPPASFDVVISCEAMEHDPHWRETFLNAARMLKRDGLMILSCAGYGRRRHGTSDASPADSPLTVADGANYYRNLGESDLRALGDFAQWFCWHRFFPDHGAHDLYFIGLGRDAVAAIPSAEICAGELDQYLRMRNQLGIY